MKKSVFLGMLILAVVALGLVACAKPPTDEIDAANSALARANADADARKYAPDSLSRARSLVAQVEVEVAAKRYDSARSLAIEAEEAANKAIEDGAGAKTRARTDAVSLISDAKTSLLEVRQSLRAAKTVAGILLDVNTAERDVNTAVETIAAADGDLAKSDFQEAGRKAQSARSLLSDVNQRISGAVQKATRRK